MTFLERIETITGLRRVEDLKMIIAQTNDSKKALQLEETLLAAGFSSQEISINTGLKDQLASVLRIKGKFEDSSESQLRLIVQTQTRGDEDLAKAVCRDCGVEAQSSNAFFPNAINFSMMDSKETRRAAK
jgi:hypothetical protein